MKRPELYQKTVDILVQAYFNNTLEHGNCFACAVGNIVAANCGIRFSKDGDSSPYGKWIPLHWEGATSLQDTATFFCNDFDGSASPLITEEIKKQISSTGYSLNELELIEQAFEGVSRYNEDYSFIEDDEYMFNGLMNVIDTLDQIHENTDTSISSQSKQRFSKQAI